MVTSSEWCAPLLLVRFLSNTGSYPRKIQAIVKEICSSGTTYTVFSPPSMVTTIIWGMPLFTTCAVVSLLDKIHASIYKMWSSGAARAVHSLPNVYQVRLQFFDLLVHLSLAYGWCTSIWRVRFSHTEYAAVGLPVVSLADGPQPFKECVPPALSMQWLLAYWTVYNHPRDAFLPHWGCNWCLSVVSPSNGLHSFNGCVSPTQSI